MRKIKCGDYFIGIIGKFFSERFLIEKQGRVLRKKTYLSAVYRYFSAVLLTEAVPIPRPLCLVEYSTSPFLLNSPW